MVTQCLRQNKCKKTVGWKKLTGFDIQVLNANVTGQRNEWGIYWVIFSFFYLSPFAPHFHHVAAYAEDLLWAMLPWGCNLRSMELLITFCSDAFLVTMLFVCMLWGSHLLLFCHLCAKKFLWRKCLQIYVIRHNVCILAHMLCCYWAD